MPQLIEWTILFQQQLRQIDQKTALRILQSIARLAVHHEGDVKKLQGVHPSTFRLRVGEYRVLFRKEGRRLLIVSVSTRQGAY